MTDEQIDNMLRDLMHTTGREALTVAGRVTWDDLTRCKLRTVVRDALRTAGEAAQAPAGTFLCRIWGEDIDHTLTALVPDWDGVRAFCVEHWTGSEDATDFDGSLTLDNLKNEFDEHEADERGGAYTQAWEIGGVSIERVCDCTPRPALASMQAPAGDELRRVLQDARDRFDTIPYADALDRRIVKRLDAALASMQAPTAPDASVIDDLCARIKAADDAAADGEYMLDSNDCISVLRGTWKGPLENDCPPKPAAPGSTQQAPEPAGVYAEPFGYWHQGETDDESDFFLASESGHVGCEKCIALFADATHALRAGRDADPLQGAADWFVKALTDCKIGDLQSRLLIGYNRASRLFDAARKATGESATHALRTTRD